MGGIWGAYMGGYRGGDGVIRQDMTGYDRIWGPWGPGSAPPPKLTINNIHPPRALPGPPGPHILSYLVISCRITPSPPLYPPIYAPHIPPMFFYDFV